MFAVANNESIAAIQEPSGAPKLIDTAPGPIALAKLIAPEKLVLEASGASIKIMRAIGAVAWAHSTSKAISVAHPASFAGDAELSVPAALLYTTENWQPVVGAAASGSLVLAGILTVVQPMSPKCVLNAANSAITFGSLYASTI